MARKHSGEQINRRSYNVEMRAIEGEEGVIEGFPLVFNQKTRINDWGGEYDEIIDARALDKTDMKDVRLFVNHDTDQITLARSRKGDANSTMSFEILPEGLKIRAKLDIENNPEAKALYSAIRRGDMDGMSFMFRVRAQEWLDIDSDIPTRIIKDISIIHEVSVVNFPAYQGTSVSARNKSSEGDYSPLAEAREQIGNDRRKAADAEVEKIKYDYLRRI